MGHGGHAAPLPAPGLSDARSPAYNPADERHPERSSLADRSGDFGPFDGRVWLNCAHQAPLPQCAAEAAREAVSWKVRPWELTTARFTGVPQRLREALARLIGADPRDVILANSASYGLHLLANGIDWRPGDEVLCMKGDFPSDILPWLGLERLGVVVRQLQPRGRVLGADEVDAAIGPRTRLLCTTWVHSFSGHGIDLDAVGAVCRARGVLFIANVSQALGAQAAGRGHGAGRRPSSAPAGSGCAGRTPPASAGCARSFATASSTTRTTGCRC